MNEPLVRGGGGHSEALPEEYNPFDGAQASYGTAGGAAAAGGRGARAAAARRGELTNVSRQARSGQAQGQGRRTRRRHHRRRLGRRRARGQALAGGVARARAAASRTRKGSVHSRDALAARISASPRARVRAALDDRERQLDEKERSIRAIVGQPNWPFPCWSFLYHDIKGEIPEQFQTLVRMFYALVLSASRSPGGSREDMRV